MKQWLYRRLVPGLQYPFLLLGGLICVHKGLWADVRLRRSWLVINLRRKYAYISKDATPINRTWSLGRFDQ